MSSDLIWDQVKSNLQGLRKNFGPQIRDLNMYLVWSTYLT